jgi:hypothetical protein
MMQARQADDGVLHRGAPCPVLNMSCLGRPAVKALHRFISIAAVFVYDLY